MKQIYKIATFASDGETYTAIYCESLNELAVETAGDIVCTEQDALEWVLDETPWDGNEDLDFAADWPEMTDKDYEGLSSAGLRAWIAAKE